MSDPLDGFRGDSADVTSLLLRGVRTGEEAAELIKSELGRNIIATANKVMDEAEEGIMSANPTDAAAITNHQISYKAAKMAKSWLIQSIKNGKAATAQLLQEQENQHV